MSLVNLEGSNLIKFWIFSFDFQYFLLIADTYPGSITAGGYTNPTQWIENQYKRCKGLKTFDEMKIYFEFY